MSLTKTRIWVRTSVLNEAAKGFQGGRGDNDWGWARATLLSGNVEQAALPEEQRTPVKVLVQDEDSPLNGTTVEIPAALVVPKKKKKISSRPGGGKAMTGASKVSSDPNIVFANHCESAELSDDDDDGADDMGVGVVALVPPDDLIHLTHLHEASVTYSLRRRYKQDMIYTSTGPILLAINPFKAMSKLYGEDCMATYFRHGEALQRIALDPDSDEDESILAPHVYGMADEAFRTMMDCLDPMGPPMTESTDQAILVSGESGAGKTVTTKHIMSYLATLSKRRGLSKINATPPTGLKKGALLPKPGGMGASVTRQISRAASWGKGAIVEERVLESNPILEAFGNARTVRNDNSSRFGKFIELQFKNTGSLIGAAIETYLLEKVRLVHQSPGERNYHIFYQILAGANDDERKRFFLNDYTVKDFKMTSGSGTFDRRDGVDDKDSMNMLFRAMGTMGFDADQLDDIFGVTIAMMHLSNVVFSSVSADESKVEDSDGHLNAVLQLLGFKREDFNQALCYFTITAGRETHSRSLSKEKAEKGLEALIKATYGGLFDYLVKNVNERITFKGPGVKAAYIGVLDIFGFEVFKKNSFEQLCINYCNEALQQQFNKVVFSTEQAEYEKEGIEWSFIEFPDNKEVLDLIDNKGSGIIPILNDMCTAVGLTDLNFARDMYQRVKNPRFEANHLHVGKGQFVVHHYALSVTYDTDGFVEKNKNELPKEATQLLESSSKPLVQSLAKIISPPAPAAKGPGAGPVRRFGGKKKVRTVGATFVQQLKKLRTRIDSTNPHYIRCLKPNQHLGPNDFNPVLVSEQLRSLGVVEAIKLSRMGFPQRYEHDLFLHRYGIIAADEIKGTEGPDRLMALVKILARKIKSSANSVDENDLSAGEKRELTKSIKASDSGMQVGKTKVFLQQEAFDELERLRIDEYDTAVIKIQAQARVHLAKNVKERKKREAEERARKEAEEKARREAEEKARREREALEKAQREAEERAKREAKEAARKAAEEEARRIAEEKLRFEAEQKAKKAAEERARLEAEEAARKAAEDEARTIAEAKAKREAEEKARKEAEEQARKEAEQRAREEAEKRARKVSEEYSRDYDEESVQDSVATSASSASAEKSKSTLKGFSTRGFFARRGSSKRSRHQRSYAMKSVDKQSNRKLAHEAAAPTSKKPSKFTSLRTPFKQSGKKPAAPYGGANNPVVPMATHAESEEEVQEHEGRALSFTLPPLHIGEYDVALPLTTAGFMINVGEIQGCVAFVSYRPFPDGNIGPAEKEGLIRTPGDKIVAINGASTKNLSFREVVMLLAESRARGMAFIRFQESQYAYPGMRIQVYPPGQGGN